MANEKEPHTPAEASREGLRELDNHEHHNTTAHTPAQHSSGPKFDETPSEVHRGGPLPNQKK